MENGLKATGSVGVTEYDLRAALDRAVKVTLGNVRKPWEFTRTEYMAHVKEVTGLQLDRKVAMARLKEAVDRGELLTRDKVRDKGKTVRVWWLPDAGPPQNSCVPCTQSDDCGPF